MKVAHRHSLLSVATRLCCAAILAGGLSIAQAQQNNGPGWNELSAAQRLALRPLQTQWVSIDASRKQKWLDVATRYPAMPAEQQQRLHSRMAEWAAMSPAQRNTARIQYEQSKQLPAAERQARWDEYQLLPEDQRQALAKQAAGRAPAAAASAAATSAAAKRAAAGQAQTKSNIVEPAQRRIKPSPVGTATVQATVGASTRPINQGPTPPRHQQAGLPKIAATPGFVDSATLLPQRGPQGAAATEPVRPLP